jgi:AraC-like DNA-binding protein
VRRAREFLEEHYADRVSLRDLSRLTGLSPFHLHRSFSRRIGMPPHAYQVHVRISRARSFLRGGRAISDIASSTGFADQSHFTYAFKRLMGVTPGQYARARNYNTSPPAGL